MITHGEIVECVISAGLLLIKSFGKINFWAPW